MIASLGILFLAGMVMARLCERARLPRIVGMLAAGIALGPCALNALSGEIMGISAALRQMALIVILARAGLALNVRDLRAVGRRC